MVSLTRQWSHTSSAPFAHFRCPKLSSSHSREAFQIVLVLIKQQLNRGLLQELPGLKSSPTCHETWGKPGRCPCSCSALLMGGTVGAAPFRDVCSA